MNLPNESRTYLRSECAVFRKTDEAYGGLSNMAPGYPVRVNGVRILTVESLYQACRFPHLPEVQRKIIAQHSPMTAKMVSKPYRNDSRADWDRVRVKVMRWCLRMKLTQHWPKFSQLLLSTGDLSIVEDSRKDNFWGALPKDNGTLVGINVLGRLLMELREAIKQGGELRRVEPPTIADFLFFGEPLQVVDFPTDKSGTIAVEVLASKDSYDELILPLFAEDAASMPTPASVTAASTSSERSHGMIADLKPYPDYKPAGLPWLDSIPGQWAMAPNRALMSDRRDRVGEKAHEYTLLSLTLGGVIPRDMENPKGKFPAQFNTYKIVRPNDFVFCLFDIDETPRGVGLSNHAGMITGAYDVFSPTHRINPRFLYYYYLFVDQGKLMKPYYVGLRKTIQRGTFAGIKAPLPLPAEQAAIVRFLDHWNGRLEKAIRSKRRVIALLYEQKQAIIHRAVTRGLDPNVKLKPSGIPWLGEIPAHWGIVRNMALFSHRVESGIAGLPVLQVSLRSGITAEELDQFGRPKKLIADPTKYKLIRKGDMSYNTMRMWQGAVGVAPTDGLVSPAYVVLKPRQSTCPEFYDFVFHTEVYKQQVNRQSTGIVSDRNRLYWDSFKQMPNLTLPCAEQEKIVAFIASETIPLTTAIARTEREIALMQEYRTRLTADVVTGKLDVRTVAAQLPDPEDECELEEVEG